MFQHLGLSILPRRNEVTEAADAGEAALRFVCRCILQLPFRAGAAMCMLRLRSTPESGLLTPSQPAKRDGTRAALLPGVIPQTLGPSFSFKPAGSICVTTLVENSVYGRSLQAEHGLAFHIRTEHHSLLFDTGQSDLLLKNAAILGIRMESVEAVVLSHGHYDHTGGLKAVRVLAPGSRLYLNPSGLAPKFAGNSDGTSRAVGLPEASALMIRQSSSSVVWTTKPTEVLEGIFVTGEIPRQNTFEDTGGRFFLDEACLKRDPLIDDQALFFDTNDGLVVLMGCAHAGVVNTVRYIQQITNGRPVHALLGGFHLLDASQERLAKTLDSLDAWGIQRIAAAHCTGVAATARLWTAFPARCCSCAVGTSLVFHRNERLAFA